MAFWQITAKDLHLLVRDRRSFAVLLLLPLVFIVIIGLTTGKFLGWRSSNQVLKIVAVDATDYEAIGGERFMTPPEGGDEADASYVPLSAGARDAERGVAGHIVVGVLNGVQKAAGVEVRTVKGWREQLELPATDGDGEEAARRMVAAENVNAAVVFTPEFYRQVYHLELEDLAARNAENPLPSEKLEQMGVELVTTDPQSGAASAIAAIVGYQLRDVIEPILGCRSERAQNLTIAQRGSAKYRRLCGPVNRMGSSPPPKLLSPQEQEGEIRSSVYEDLVPSYTVMFVFFLVNVMAHSFLHERATGTMRRLRIAPISGWSVLVGKTLPFLVVSLVQTALLFLAGRLLFGMSWGDHPWMLLPVIFATSCAATGLGLLIATLVKSDAQVSAYATTVVIVLAGISGCFMPRQWLPDLMQQISLATPHAWALIAYDQLLSAAVPDLGTVWRCVGMLVAFAAAFFTVGGVRFKKID